jgi:hypothetical protein
MYSRVFLNPMVRRQGPFSCENFATIAPALNDLLSHDTKSHALKKRPRRDTHLGMQVTDASAHGPRRHSIKQCTGYTLALNLGVHVEKIETSCGIDSSEVAAGDLMHRALE